MLREDLSRYLDGLLDAARVEDYCPNGLQVEGRPEVRFVASGVTASVALIDAAAAMGADALLVHHGYFWRGEDPRLVGTRKRRIEALLGASLNLYAYHLPLDLHPVFGNNAQLADRIGLVLEGRTGEQDLLCHGAPARVRPLGELSEHIETSLGRAPLVIGEPAREIRRIAWCTGAAQGFFERAIALGVDAYLTGEISEQHVHLARESGVAFIAAGHHATERYGVQAVGEHLAREFGLHHAFIDVPSPV
jgi:dinuclear metal center YbgI/SA1388 family protein